MENKNLIIVFSVVLAASFIGALAGAYLVEKTQGPSFSREQQTPYEMPPQNRQMMPNGEQGPFPGGQPNSPGGQTQNSGAQTIPNAGAVQPPPNCVGRKATDPDLPQDCKIWFSMPR